ncbi:MAG: hypothetical protein ACRC62_10815 [Microcoleus sp.]
MSTINSQSIDSQRSIASGDARTTTLNDRSRAGTLALQLSTINYQLSNLLISQ